MKAQIVNMLGFVVHTVSAAIIQPCCCRVPVATDSANMTGHGCVSVKL